MSDAATRRRSEGKTANAQAVRKEERGSCILGNRDEAGQGEVERRQGPERVQTKTARKKKKRKASSVIRKTIVDDKVLDLITIVFGDGPVKPVAASVGVSSHPYIHARRSTTRTITKNSIAAIIPLQNKYTLDDFKWYTRLQLQRMGIERCGDRRQLKITYIQGIPHKLCKGPMHPEGKLVPLTEFHKLGRRTQTKRVVYRSWCVSCDSHRHGSERMVKVARMKPFMVELVHRLGKVEAARRIGISYNSFHKLYDKNTVWMKRRTARAVITALQEVRAKDEVRSRMDIRRGNYLRGIPEQRPQAREQFYKVHGDNDTQARTRYRITHREHENEVARRRRRERRLTASAT